MGIESQLHSASHSIGLPIFILFAVPLIIAIAFQIVKAFDKKPEQQGYGKPNYPKQGNRLAAIFSLVFLLFAGLFSYQVYNGNIHSLKSVNMQNLAR